MMPPYVDAVAVTVHGHAVGPPEQPRHRGQLLEPVVARAVPGVLEDYDNGGGPRPPRRRELRTQGLNARIRLIVEEVEVVDEARGLAHAEVEEGVDAALGHVHDLRRGARRDEPAELAGHRGDPALLGGG